MKNALARLSILLAAFAPTLHAADEDVAGFVRLSETPATDNLAWDDPNRFTDVPLLENVAFSGLVESASSDVITAQGAFWRPQQFEAGSFEVEVIDGAAAGAKFDVTANSGNTITVDLAGGNLAGIANGDKICITSKWTLNRLFPDGGNLTASTAATRGTEVIFPTDTPGGADFTGAAIFVYRSDLGRWIDDATPGVDVGDQLIPAGALLVIRQNSASPLRPAFSGFRAGGAAPFKATINFAQAGLDNFANAHVIAGEGSVTADTSGASGEGGEPQHGGNATPASVWFRYDATQAGTVTVRSQFSNFDTILAAYSGGAVGSLTLLSSNDDAPGETWSETTFTVAAGQSYYVALDGKAGATGTGVLGFEFSETVDMPEIVVEQPAANGLVDGVSAVAFGNVNAGATAQRVFTIRNTGTANLTGLAASWNGNAAGRFTAGAFGATTLAPGASTTLTVTFAPVAAGNESGTLRIASNDADENPFDVSITGTGVASEIVVEQPVNNGLIDGVSGVSFGNSNVGVAAPLTFTIRNTGNAALTGLAASVDGTNSAEFVAGALGATTLNPGQSTTVSVTFTPAAAGVRAAALHIANNDPNENPFDIALSGTGVMPEIAIEQPLNTGLADGTSTIDFGDVDALDDAARTFTIRNLGDGPLTGLALSVDGTNASEFVAANLSATTVAPNATATFTVTFTPTAAGTRTAAVHVTSNDTNESPFDINLTGRGLDPEISVEEPATNVLVDAGAARDYGDSNVGIAVQKTFTIKNVGTADLTGLATTFAGTHAVDFSAAAFGSTTVAAGASTTVVVTFTPGAAGARTATLRIASNDRDENPFDIPLTGNGTMPEIAVEQPVNTNLADGAATIDFGDVIATQNSPRTFTIRNTGDGPLTGLALSVDGANASEFVASALSSTTVAPNATATFVVTFTPTAAGARNAAVHVSSNDADENPFDIALTGNGVDPEIAVEQPAASGLADGASARDFGFADVGNSTQLTFTIRNAGTANLTGLAASFAGTNASDFSAGAFGATTLAPAASTTVTVTFMPDAVGARSGILRIASNDRDENPFDINLTGFGGTPDIEVEESGQILVDGGSITFDDLLTGGGTSTSVTLTIRNTGTVVLSNLATSIDGANAAEFSVSALGATTLNPNEDTSLTITLTPAAAGTKTAALHIASDDPDENPFDINLSGVQIESTTMESWAESFGLTGDDALPTADGDGDQISLLEEYAYNLDPTAFDQQLLTPGSGTSGLPSMRLVGDRLQIEFLRRRSDPNLTYTPQFGATLPDGFSDATEPEVVSHIDLNFERVIVQDSATTATHGVRFVRSLLELTQP